MYRQEVRDQSLKGLKGVALILAVLAASVLGSAVFTLLGRVMGDIAAIGFIAYCCVMAWFLLSYYVMGFVYVTDGNCLRVFRTYGKRERHVCDVWLGCVQAYGEPERVQKRFEGAGVDRAIKKQCALEVFALAYTTGGKVRILHIQPDDTLKTKILEQVKK